MPFRLPDDDYYPPEPVTRSLTGPGSTDAAAPPLIGNAPQVAAAPTAGQGLALDTSGKVPLGTSLFKFVTWASGDTTPSVLGGKAFKTANAGATTITFFDDGIEGQEITIVFGDANTTLTDGGNLALAGGFTSTTNDVMHLIYDGTVWCEISRSII